MMSHYKRKSISLIAQKVGATAPNPGSLELVIAIRRTGKVLSVTVRRSSGSKDTDAYFCEIAKQASFEKVPKCFTDETYYLRISGKDLAHTGMCQ